MDVVVTLSDADQPKLRRHPRSCQSRRPARDIRKYFLGRGDAAEQFRAHDSPVIVPSDAMSMP